MTSRVQPAGAADRYTDLSFTASIDWIDLAVGGLPGTNFHTVRKRLRAVGFSVTWVEQADEDTYVLRIHDPGTPGDVYRRLRRAGMNADGATVRAVEISIDARHPTGNLARLLEVTTDFVTRHAERPASSWRVAGYEGTNGLVSWGGDRIELQNRLVETLTAHAGHQHDDTRLRAYLRTTVSRTRRTDREELRPEKRSARLEIVLKGDAVPFRTLADWSSFKLEKLNALVRYRRLTVEPMSGIAKAVWNSRHRRPVSKVGSDLEREQHKRQHRPGTKADGGMTERTYEALRLLSKRSANSWGNRESRPARGRLACDRDPSPRAPASGFPGVPRAQVVDLAGERESTLNTMRPQEQGISGSTDTRSGNTTPPPADTRTVAASMFPQPIPSTTRAVGDDGAGGQQHDSVGST